MLVRLLLTAAGLLLAAPAVAQGVLRVVSPWEITSVEPSRTGYIFTRMQVAETLVGADDGGLPVPGLATAWTPSADGLNWRLTLREGATFHDGTPVTAEAAAASLRRAKAQPGPFATVPVAEITAPDARTVLLRLTEPFAPLPAFLAHSSAQVLAPASFDETGAVRRVIGSGPYRIVSMEPTLRMEVARFEGWTGPKPAIERATYQVVPRSETRAVMAESGQADLVFILDPASQDRLRRSRRVDVRVLPIPRVQVLKPNVGLPFFNDVRERRAISLLIDRTGIARAILRNSEIAATQFFPPSLDEWHVPSLPALSYDPAQARRLLAEAGWAPGADGVLQRDGRPFRVTLRTFPDRQELPVVATALQEQFRAAGIDLQVSVGNSSEIPSGHRDGSLELALFARNLSLVPDPLGTLRQDFASAGGDYGAMGWSSTELTDALNRLGSVSDPAERATLRGRVAAIVQAELPLIPIAWYDHSVAVSRRLADVSVDPLELSYRISDIRWAE